MFSLTFDWKGGLWGYRRPENAIATQVANEDKTSTLIQGSGLFRGVFFFGKYVSDLREIFVPCMLVYVKCFSYLCSGFEERW